MPNEKKELDSTNKNLQNFEKLYYKFLFTIYISMCVVQHYNS